MMLLGWLAYEMLWNAGNAWKILPIKYIVLSSIIFSLIIFINYFF